MKIFEQIPKRNAPYCNNVLAIPTTEFNYLWILKKI